MRTGKNKFVIVARNLATDEKFVCYKGTNMQEGTRTMRVFRQMDKEEGNEGLYAYSVVKEGTLGYERLQMV